jgi:hypothetical protein
VSAEDLARLAGGDEYELAVSEIRKMVADARRRTLDQHPLFHPQNQETK